MNPKENKAWGFLLVFSFLARLIDLGTRALSHDESLHALYSYYWSQGLNYQHDPMMHGPLLFHLNGFLFSLVPATDFTARLIPALAGTACVAMLLLFRRWLGNWGAFWAALLVSMDPGHLYYSRYLRNDIYISLFTLLMVWALLRYREEQQPRHLVWLSVGLGLSFSCKEVCFIHGVMLGAGALLFMGIDLWRTKDITLSGVLHHPLFQCAALILLLALPFSTGLFLPEASWHPPRQVDPEILDQALWLGLSLVGVTVVAGSLLFYTLNKWTMWLTSAALFWGIQFTLYTTLFTHVRVGTAGGLAGSLGYWLAQHGVQRGNDDPAFYLTLLLLYTPVLLVGAVAAIRHRKDFTIAFCLWWVVVHAVVYAWAGERMPWLLLHISLPLCLLTGRMIPELFRSMTLEGTVLKGVVAVGLFQLIVNSLRLVGPNAQGPWEPLTYAHTGKDFKVALRLIDDHLLQHPNTTFQADPAYAWPTAWYTRSTGAAFQTTEFPDQIEDTVSAVLVHPRLRTDFQEAGWTSRLQVDMTQWPRFHYHRISGENLKNVFTNPTTREKLLPYVLLRDQPAWRHHEFPGPNQFLLMTRTPDA